MKIWMLLELEQRESWIIECGEVCLVARVWMQERVLFGGSLLSCLAGWHGRFLGWIASDCFSGSFLKDVSIFLPFDPACTVVE